MIIYTAGSVVFKKSLIGKMSSICLSIIELHTIFHSELHRFYHQSEAEVMNSS